MLSEQFNESEDENQLQITSYQVNGVRSTVDQVFRNSTVCPSPTLVKMHQYLMIGLAGDEVKSKMTDTMKKSEIECAVFLSYSNFCKLYLEGECIESNAHNVNPPGGLTLELLMGADNRSRNKTSDLVTGESLWRKFSDLQTYIINHMNTAWDPTPPSGPNMWGII